MLTVRQYESGEQHVSGVIDTPEEQALAQTALGFGEYVGPNGLTVFPGILAVIGRYVDWWSVPAYWK